MKKGKVFRHICVFLAAGLTLIQGGSTYAREAETDTVKKIAVLTYSFSSEYWGYVSQGCKAYDRADLSIDVVVEEPSSSVASDEQSIMLQSDLDENRYDGYVIAAIDHSEIEKILDKAEVPVVAVDSVIDADCIVSCVGTDNEVAAAAGMKKAVSMAKDIGWEKVECVMIGGREEDSNEQSRMDGFRSGIEDAGGTWSEDVYLTDKSEAQAQEAMGKIMEDHPEGIAIICCYNDTLAEAALAASEENEAYKDTVFVGFDGNGSICERILNDESYAHFVTVAQNPYEMGYRAVEALAKHFAGLDAEQSPSGDDGEMGSAADDAEASSSGNEEGPRKEESKTSERMAFIDSGYSVITKENVKERLIQIQSHLS